jgi:hypothetical protein
MVEEKNKRARSSQLLVIFFSVSLLEGPELGGRGGFNLCFAAKE